MDHEESITFNDSYDLNKDEVIYHVHVYFQDCLKNSKPVEIGGLSEGIVWEAMMSANRYQLDNFVMIVDNNGLQLDGPCDQIMPHIDLSAKAAAFGFEVYDIDGHDMQQIFDAFDKIRAAKNGKPKFINAKTVKGKVLSIGIRDCFGQSAPYERLLAVNGITVENIVEKAMKGI